MGAYLGDSRNLMIYNNYVNHKSQILGVDIKYNYIDFLDLLSNNFAGDL